MFIFLVFGRRVFVMWVALQPAVGVGYSYALFLTLQPVLVEEWVYLLVEELFFYFSYGIGQCCDVLQLGMQVLLSGECKLPN